MGILAPVRARRIDARFADENCTLAVNGIAAETQR